MADRNERILMELVKKPGNDECAECGSKNPIFASYNIGIFLCYRCAGIHRSLGVHISKTKHLKLDRWEDSQIERMKEVGNVTARLKYEERVPLCYQRPRENDHYILIEQWIKAKYIREEFSHPERQTYINGHMVGILNKRGKEDPRFYPRKFVLDESKDMFMYFVRENKEPKTIIKISEMNVAFMPKKIGLDYSLQFTFSKDGSFRHIYVYHDDPEVITNWYMAIRCSKLHRLQVAFPSANENELVERLTDNFSKEGWLYKGGPKYNYAGKKVWLTLMDRILMCHLKPLDANPKLDIFIGHSSDGYRVTEEEEAGTWPHPYKFTLFTPERSYNFETAYLSEKKEWMTVLQDVIDRPLTSRDYSQRLSRKSL